MVTARREFRHLQGCAGASDGRTFTGSGGRGFILALAAFLSLASAAAAAPPTRVVSLDFCADQFLLALAERRQIAAVSTEAEGENSYLAKKASGLPQTNDNLENIIRLKPDLVLRIWGGGYGVSEMLERFRVPVVSIAFTEDLDSLRRSIREVAHVLGREARAEYLIGEMDIRLLAVQEKLRSVPNSARLRAIYLTPDGATAGAGTLMDAMMQAAGLRNMMAEAGYKGWHKMDPEELLMSNPDVTVLGFKDLSSNAVEQWQMQDHDAVKRFVAARPSLTIPARVLACTGWNFVDGVEEIFNQLVAPRIKGMEPVFSGEERP